MDLSLIDNIVFDYDLKDAYKFSDAYIVCADYDGQPMNEDQLNELNENSEFVHEKLIEYLF